MKTRTLGRTGLKVSEIGLGGLFISSYGTGFDEADRVIRRALDLGINFIDTAPGYANSEEVLGKVLPKIDRPYILSTKVGYIPSPYKCQDKKFIQDAFQASLKRLNRASVDILMIHEPDRADIHDWWTDKENFQGPVMEVLKEAQDAGQAKFIGLGGTTAYEMAHVVATGRFDVLLTAFQHDLLWREAKHAVLPAAKKHKMGVIIGSPLHQGALAKQYVNDIANPPMWLSPPRRDQYAKLYELVNDLKMSLPELAIRFELSNPQVSTVLVGVRNLQELEENASFSDKGPLPKDVLKQLDKIAKLVPFRPYNEPLGLPFKS